jgi:hypothetical protein
MIWNRSASSLGNKGEECLLKEQLEQRWPASEFPVHIDIVGAADTSAVGVQVWNGADITIIERAYPKDHVRAPHPVATAAMAKVDEILTRLKALRKV